MVLLGALVIYWTTDFDIPLWAAVLMFFAPDISMIGYALGPRRGAAIYNAVHLYGAGVVLAALGFWVGPFWLWPLGLLWLAHAGFDRMLGYGLKLPSDFRDTHLGRIGRR